MKNFKYLVIILVLIGVTIYLIASYTKKEVVLNEPNTPVNTTEEYVSYKNSEYSPEFVYPKSWGEVAINPGNKNCPEEYGYRTADALHVFDWEYSFAEIKLPGSDSMIRTGVRTYELDPKNLNDCGDDFLLKIARGQVNPESISSFKLSKITIPSGLSGIYNIEASLLNTESRKQYTFFIDQGSKIYIIQTYMSFIPYFNSPELKEMEEIFGGDMKTYLEQGKSAENIRKKFEQFKTLSESLKFSGE